MRARESGDRYIDDFVEGPEHVPTVCSDYAYAAKASDLFLSRLSRMVPREQHRSRAASRIGSFRGWTCGGLIVGDATLDWGCLACRGAC